MEGGQGGVVVEEEGGGGHEGGVEARGAGQSLEGPQARRSVQRRQ